MLLEVLGMFIMCFMGGGGMFTIRYRAKLDQSIVSDYEFWLFRLPKSTHLVVDQTRSAWKWLPIKKKKMAPTDSGV